MIDNVYEIISDFPFIRMNEEQRILVRVHILETLNEKKNIRSAACHYNRQYVLFRNLIMKLGIFLNDSGDYVYQEDKEYKFKRCGFNRTLKEIIKLKNTGHIKRRLIEEDIRKPICEQCGWDYKLHPWINNLNEDCIPLELHHIDGDNKNNELNNLQLLCPNCHSMTINHAGRNSINRVTFKHIKYTE